MKHYKRFKVDFYSDYVPIPTTIYETITKNKGYKAKFYSALDKVECIRTEFEMLYRQGYTHVMNMPGDLDQVILTANYYKIVCQDNRVLKFTSDLCSQRLSQL